MTYSQSKLDRRRTLYRWLLITWTSFMAVTIFMIAAVARPLWLKINLLESPEIVAAAEPYALFILFTLLLGLSAGALCPAWRFWRLMVQTARPQPKESWRWPHVLAGVWGGFGCYFFFKSAIFAKSLIVYVELTGPTLADMLFTRFYGSFTYLWMLTPLLMSIIACLLFIASHFLRRKGLV